MTPQNITLTKAEINEQHDRCCRAFLDAGIVPFKWHQLSEDGVVKQELRRRSGTHDNGPGRFEYILSNDWISLPRCDKKRSEKIAKQLRRVCAEKNDLWTGVATLGTRCLVDDIRRKQRLLMSKVRQFFTEQRRFHQAKLIFSVAHMSVRNRNTRLLYQDAQRRLLYHVHVHFLFFPPPPGPKFQRFETRFKDRFGDGSGLEPVRDMHATVTYLTAVQDRSDIIVHNEFVAWHEQISRTARLRIYREFNPAKPINYPKKADNYSGYFGHISRKRENIFCGKIWCGNKRFTIWENLKESARIVYENERVVREPDR